MTQRRHISDIHAEEHRSHRQSQYLRQLKTLDDEGRMYYLQVFDAIAQKRRVDGDVLRLVESGRRFPDAYRMCRDLADLAEATLRARLQNRTEECHCLQRMLDDINVAVNALTNRQCLHHSRETISAYRRLQEMARACSPN